MIFPWLKTQLTKKKKTDIGTGVQMSKKLQYNSPAPQGNNQQTVANM